MGNSTYHFDAIYKSMLELGSPEHFRQIVLTHMTAILISVKRRFKSARPPRIAERQ